MPQRGCQRAPPMPFRGMDDHARRLVDGREPLVLVKNLEGNLLRFRPFAGRLGPSNLDPIAGPQTMTGLGRLAANSDAVGIDQPSQMPTAELRESSGKNDIQALAGLVGRNDEFVARPWLL